MIPCLLLGLLLAGFSTPGQSDDIFARVRGVLAASGEGELAAEALARKNYKQVEAMLAAARPTSDAERAELLSVRAAIEFIEGKMDLAIDSFQAASKLAPLKDGDSFTLAMAFVNLNEDSRARGVLSTLAQKHPDEAIYLYWLGRLDYDQRRYEEAVSKLTNAARLAPQSARVWDGLGLALDMQGQMEQARGAFDKAVTLNRSQTHPSAWPPHNLGYLLLRMNQLPEAEAALREALRYDSNFAQAHYHLGRVLEKEAREPEAVGEYLQAISLDTSAPDACYSLAMLYRKLHRETDAEAMFSEYRRRKWALPRLDLKSPEGIAQ